MWNFLPTRIDFFFYTKLTPYIQQWRMHSLFLELHWDPWQELQLDAGQANTLLCHFCKVEYLECWNGWSVHEFKPSFYSLHGWGAPPSDTHWTLFASMLPVQATISVVPSMLALQPIGGATPRQITITTSQLLCVRKMHVPCLHDSGSGIWNKRYLLFTLASISLKLSHFLF